MKKCPRCGAENPDDALYCNKCGASLMMGNVMGMSSLQSPQQSQSGLPQEIPSHMAEAVLVTLFCCLPFGIPAIVYASQVDSKKAAGDIQGAQHASRQAYTWVKIAFFTGLGFSILYFLFMFLGFMQAGIS